MIEASDFTHVNNCSYGNPRDVLSWTRLAVGEEGYGDAVHRAKAVGGSRYRAKDYGGGIVFTTYSLLGLIKRLNELKAEAEASA